MSILPTPTTVTPAKAGVQSGKALCLLALDSGLRRNDEEGSVG